MNEVLWFVLLFIVSIGAVALGLFLVVLVDEVLKQRMEDAAED